MQICLKETPWRELFWIKLFNGRLDCGRDTLTPVSICANQEAVVLKEKPQTAGKSQVTDLLHLDTQQEGSVL